MKFFISLLSLFLAIIIVHAREPFCKKVQNLRIKECGNSTIDEIDRKGQVCDLASRLKSFARWLETHEKPCSTIVKDVEARYWYFLDTTRYHLDYSGVLWFNLGTAFKSYPKTYGDN